MSESAVERAPARRLTLADRVGEPWRYALVVALVTRVAYGLVAFASNWYLSTSTVGAPNRSFVDIWFNWDALRFLSIATSGYEGFGTPPNSTAFFPLYPLLIRAVGLTGLPHTVAALLISTVASVVAFAFLYRLAADPSARESSAGESVEGGEEQPVLGRRAVLYLAVFPTAVFLIAPYSESLFLAGAIPAFYYARRTRWHLAALPAAVAMGTRFAGAFLLVGLFFEFLRQRHFTFERVANAALAGIVGLLPLLAYGAYLSQAKGDPLYFFTDQRIGWGRAFVGPIAALRNTIGRWDDVLASNWIIAYRVEVFAAAVGIGLVVWALLKREWGYAAFMGTTMVVLVSSTEYMSIPRILLSFFPVALFVAQATRRRPLLHEAYLAVCVPLAALGVIVYTRGTWFF